MKIQKYYDRDHFTYDEKVSICQKSDNRCCHCGRKVFINYGATIDHFIPLNRGGSNNHINLIMLCHDCNQEKDNKIMSIDYVPYLKDTHKEKLEQYVSSYVQVMDIQNRTRLLAYDEYTQEITTGSVDYVGHRTKRKTVPISKFKLKLATWNDLDRLHEYLVKYLKKYDALDDEPSARENIIFWMQFGSVYYIERNGEINMMIAITVKNVSDDEGFRGSTFLPSMYIFPFYNTDLSFAIARNIVTAIPLHIIEEANLDFIPFSVIMLNDDKMLNKIAYFYGNAQDDAVNGFTCIHYTVGDVSSENDFVDVENMTPSEKKTYDFLMKFEDVTNKMFAYYEKYEDRASISWMISSIYSYERVKDTPLMKYYERLIVMPEDEE